MQVNIIRKSHFVIILFLSGCVFFKSPENFEVAYFEKVGDYYEIELRGTRFLMVHDPVSALEGKMYVEEHIIKVPRITGEVNGEEIPRKKGYYKYLGDVSFSGDKMTVNLFADNYDDNTKDPISWNGKYTLMERIQ